MPDYLVKTSIPTADANQVVDRERIIRAKNEAATGEKP